MAAINILEFARAISKTYDEKHYPIIMMPDGKEYVIEKYETNHENNYNGEYHQGLKFVEAKYKKKTSGIIFSETGEMTVK